MTRPKLQDFVRFYLDCDWYQLGLVLGINDRRLDIIRHDCRDKFLDCQQEMFKLWLQTDPDASYKKLVGALFAAGDHGNAVRLSKAHGKHCYRSASSCHCYESNMLARAEC